MKTLIEARSLTKTYPLAGLGVPALRGVSLTIEEGELAAIVGPSGCGKSTLMHLLGLLDTPDAGRIIFDLRDVQNLADDDRAQLRAEKIGFIFQQFNLLQRVSALENVLLPTLYRTTATPRSATVAKARQLLSELGLAQRLTHHPNQLSGGEQQRVAIARALINDPVLLLADEPTGNLDSHSGSEILGILSRLHGLGKTILVVTHEPRVAAFCQRTIHLEDGRIVSPKVNHD